jgi:hypothetical protein
MPRRKGLEVVPVNSEESEEEGIEEEEIEDTSSEDNKDELA